MRTAESTLASGAPLSNAVWPGLGLTDPSPEAPRSSMCDVAGRIDRVDEDDVRRDVCGGKSVMPLIWWLPLLFRLLCGADGMRGCGYKPGLSRWGGTEPGGSEEKLLLTAFHQPSILVTRFFFRFNCVSVVVVDTDLFEPPDVCRARSWSKPDRFGFGDTL